MGRCLSVVYFSIGPTAQDTISLKIERSEGKYSIIDFRGFNKTVLQKFLENNITEIRL